MRREERVTVQGPVKEQQPDGMSHRGGGSHGGCMMCLLCSDAEGARPHPSEPSVVAGQSPGVESSLHPMDVGAPHSPRRKGRGTPPTASRPSDSPAPIPRPQSPTAKPHTISAVPRWTAQQPPPGEQGHPHTRHPCLCSVAPSAASCALLPATRGSHACRHCIRQRAESRALGR